LDAKYVHVPGNKREKLDAKAVEGHFVGLPQNRKGYMASDSWNLLKVYVSHDVTFVETPETSGRVMIQVGGQVPESEEAPMNNVEAKLESERTQLLRVMLGRSQGLEVPRKRLRRVHLPNFASQ